MTRNRYGIAEPELDVQQVLPHSMLDIICTPLVAFDEAGNRLGMGAATTIAPSPAGTSTSSAQDPWGSPTTASRWMPSPGAVGRAAPRSSPPAAAGTLPDQAGGALRFNKQANDLHLGDFCAGT
jgi:5-formyltetrahydrofolate cyclo-ligase